jgi:hypothetical protein
VFLEVTWELCRYVGSEVPTAVLHFWDIIHVRNQAQLSCLLAHFFMLFSCLAYSSNLNMNRHVYNEISIIFQWTIRHYIPEDRTVQFHQQILKATLKETELKYTVTVKGLNTKTSYIPDLSSHKNAK